MSAADACRYFNDFLVEIVSREIDILFHLIFINYLIGGGGTFTSSVGNITKIVVNANTSTISGEGWSGNTWTGDSSSVPFGSNIYSFKELICTVESELTPGEHTATYGDTLADVTLPDGWAWVDDTTSVGSVGTHTFKANFTPEDTANYNTLNNVDVTVKVNKAANPATVTDTATVTKGGNTVDLASNVTLNGATGEVTYAIDGEANGCSLNGSVLTSGNNTGSVTVNVSVAADDNYPSLQLPTQEPTMSGTRPLGTPIIRTATPPASPRRSPRLSTMTTLRRARPQPRPSRSPSPARMKPST